MILQAGVISAIFNAYNTRFQAAYTITEPWYTRMAMDVPSSTRTNNYMWLNKIPKMRQWLGERVLNNLAAQTYAITNVPYEDTLEVDEFDIADDQFGIYGPMVDMLGQQAKKWPDDLVTSLLRLGGTTLVSDGKNFFDTTHPQNVSNPSVGSAQVNLYTNTPLTAANFATVRATMAAFVGEDGRPFGILPNLLVVPPQLEVTARQILNGAIIANAGGTAAASNVLVGMADILMVPELAVDSDTWYLLDTTKPIKPFIFQMREAPNMVQLTGEQTDNRFFRHKLVMGIDARGNAGYGLWFLASKCVGH